MPSPDDSRAAVAGSCSKSHQSLLTLPPSTWCAAVALPHRKPSGKSLTRSGSGLVVLVHRGEDLVRGGLVAEDLLQAAEHGLLDLRVGPQLIHERDGLVVLDV